ncbi:hypothetical protein LA080_001882 [Diaporthe eres]|nr:hypothetical protein LA080_001882 [Diaporthe eres]
MESARLVSQFPPRINLEPQHAGVIKRIRQACSNCRQRKTKCSGEKPQCSELLQRIRTIEDQLAKLSEVQRHRIAVDPLTYSIDPGSPLQLISTLIDTYFIRVHNQPYSYFQEKSFRRSLESGSLPKCLVFAVIASALRFADLDFYRGAVHEAQGAYAREAWLSVLNDHMTAENLPSTHIAQTTNILAIIDFTSGRISSGWLKIGLAIRIAQDLQLTKESAEELSDVERERQRRVFWSIYLLDEIVSCVGFQERSGDHPYQRDLCLGYYAHKLAQHRSLRTTAECNMAHPPAPCPSAPDHSPPDEIATNEIDDDTLVLGPDHVQRVAQVREAPRLCETDTGKYELCLQTRNELLKEASYIE